MEPVAVSINDAAEAVGLGRTSIYTLIKQGKLNVVKIGRRTLVTTESIRGLVENHSVSQADV